MAKSKWHTMNETACRIMSDRMAGVVVRLGEREVPNRQPWSYRIAVEAHKGELRLTGLLYPVKGGGFCLVANRPGAILDLTVVGSPERCADQLEDFCRGCRRCTGCMGWFPSYDKHDTHRCLARP